MIVESTPLGIIERIEEAKSERDKRRNIEDGASDGLPGGRGQARVGVNRAQGKT